MFRARVLAGGAVPAAASRPDAPGRRRRRRSRSIGRSPRRSITTSPSSPERYDLAMADARVLTASLRPNPVLTASVDAARRHDLQQQHQPERRHRAGRRAARARRQARAPDGSRARGSRRRRAAAAGRRPHADPQRAERLHRRPAGAGRSAARAGIARRLQRDRRDQHGAGAIGRPRAGRARAIAARGAAVPERRPEPRDEAGGREPPPRARCSDAPTRRRSRSPASCAGTPRRCAPTRCSSRRFSCGRT